MNYLVGARRLRPAFIALTAISIGLTLLGCRTHYGVSRLKLQESLTGPKAEIFQRMLDLFNQEYSGDIQVEQQKVKPSDFRSNFEKAAKDKQPIHLLVQLSYVIPEYRKNKELEAIKCPDNKNILKPNAFLPVSVQNCIDNNNLYAVPLDFEVLGLYYNVNAVKAAGLNPDNPPVNMQQFMVWAKKLTRDFNGDGKPDQYGILLPATKNDSTLSRIWFSLFIQNGGAFLDPSGKKCLANSPAGVKALQFLVDLVNKDRVAIIGDPEKGFTSGKAAMIMQNPEMLSKFAAAGNFEFKTAVFPAFFAKPAAWGESYVVAVAKQDDTSKKNAACTFIQWMSDNSWMWAQSGQVPARKSILKSKKFKNNPLYSYQKPFIESQNIAVYPPSIPEVFSDDGSGPLSNAIVSALSKEKTPQAALNECVAAVDSILQ